MGEIFRVFGRKLENKKAKKIKILEYILFQGI
jgi:hypothetical protein